MRTPGSSFYAVATMALFLPGLAVQVNTSVHTCVRYGCVHACAFAYVRAFARSFPMYVGAVTLLLPTLCFLIALSFWCRDPCGANKGA